jgi:hypothetical protein
MEKSWRIKIEDKVETPIFYPVTKLVTLEEIENNVPTGIIKQSILKLQGVPSFKGTCNDVRKRKEFKWKYKHTKLPELVEEPEIVQ